VDTSPQTSTSISQLLGSAVRKSEHRAAVTEWLPHAERIKEVKGKRGWEKPDATKSTAPSRQGGWVVRNLTELLKTRDGKVRRYEQRIGIVSYTFDQLQEAALSAIAALAKDNPSVATILTKSPVRDSKILLSSYLQRNDSLVVKSSMPSVLSLTKSRTAEVQLAASLWYGP
jgi:armadillo repeat-containing protein 8